MTRILANTKIVGGGLPTDKALDVLFLTTDLVSVLNNGNVGIGTTTPSAKLHAVGIDATSSNFALKLDNLASSPLLYVRNDGNVGIGTATPNSKLSILSSSNTISTSSFDVKNSDGKIMFYITDELTAGIFSQSRMIIDNSVTPDYSGSGGSVFNVKKDEGVSSNISDLGTGIVSIIAIVSSYVNSARVAVHNRNGGGLAQLSLSAGSTYGANFVSGVGGLPSIFPGDLTILLKSDNGFSINSGTTNVKHFIVTPTYNFGIGANITPTAKLHVQGTDATSSNYALKTDNSTGTPLLYVANDGGVGVGVAPQFNVSATFKTKNSGTGTGFQVFNSASTKLFSIREDGFGTKFPGFVIMGLDNDPYSTLHIVKQTANTTYSRGLFRVEQTYNSTNPDFMITEIGKVVVGKANTTYGGDYKVEFNSPQNTVLGVPSTFNMALNTTNAFGQDIGGGITFGGTYDAVNTTAFGGINAVKLNAISGDYNGRLNLWVRATAGAINALSIINNGNVGIGTTTPTSKLHAVGIDATSSNFALKLDNLASSPLLYVRNDGVVSINSTNNSQLLLNTGGVTGISFLNYSQGNQQIYFDAVFENGYTIAKNTSALGLINFNGVMRFTGNTGLTVGNSFSLNTLMNLDASTKNLSIGLGDASGTARLHLYGAGGINYALKVENGLINMSNLQTGITGLVAGDLFKYADATSPSGFSIGIMP